MDKEVRTVRYDADLNITAYCFASIAQPFPNHFHDYYVIGRIDSGTRRLYCRNHTYIIQPGDFVLFNPKDNHGCMQVDGSVFSYRGLNIPKDTMLQLAADITGKSKAPRFAEPVLQNTLPDDYFCSLHRMLMCGSKEFEKEEMLLFLIAALIEQYAPAVNHNMSVYSDAIAAVCAFMEQHFDTHVSLEQLCACSHLSKSTLLRAFTKEKGVTPYRYLQSIRVNQAKLLLEAGVPPVQAAQQTGFADQSHFTHFFNAFIGITPGAYQSMFTDSNGGNVYGRRK